tara:strand:- start:674 stop:985 length:312 start_codon:yes stop_codon:yes gene_type:complete
VSSVSVLALLSSLGLVLFLSLNCVSWARAYRGREGARLCEADGGRLALARWVAVALVLVAVAKAETIGRNFLGLDFGFLKKSVSFLWIAGVYVCIMLNPYVSE